MNCLLKGKILKERKLTLSLFNIKVSFTTSPVDLNAICIVLKKELPFFFQEPEDEIVEDITEIEKK